MKRQTGKFWTVAALALMTNGFSLFGIGNASAGALARTLECTTSMARSIELNDAHLSLACSPPCKRSATLNQVFVSDCLG